MLFYEQIKKRLFEIRGGGFVRVNAFIMRYSYCGMGRYSPKAGDYLRFAYGKLCYRGKHHCGGDNYSNKGKHFKDGGYFGDSRACNYDKSAYRPRRRHDCGFYDTGRTADTSFGIYLHDPLGSSVGYVLCFRGFGQLFI